MSTKNTKLKTGSVVTFYVTLQTESVILEGKIISYEDYDADHISDPLYLIMTPIDQHIVTLEGTKPSRLDTTDSTRFNIEDYPDTQYRAFFMFEWELNTTPQFDLLIQQLTNELQ